MTFNMTELPMIYSFLVGELSGHYIVRPHLTLAHDSLDSTYELVSKVAYLIGVPLRIFQNEHEPPKIEIYNRLEQDKNARIIRNLCIIRTAIERNYRKINDIMRMEYRGLLSMPEILPTSSMQQLSNDGISFIKKSSTKLCHHIIEINRLISDRINNCKSRLYISIFGGSCSF